MSTSPQPPMPGTSFNPFDPAFLANPYPMYSLARQFRPVSFEPARGIWSVFGYDDCVAVLKDHATWSSQQAMSTEDMPATMLGSDPPRHQRLRGLVSQAFTPRMVDALEPRIRALATQLLDDIDASAPVDIIDAYTSPLPVTVIAEILGVPASDRKKFRVWSNDVVAGIGGTSGNDTSVADNFVASFAELQAYLGAIVEERRKDPRADLISGLIAAEEAGDRLSAPELMQMLILLLVAGNETTTNLIGNALIEFMRHPEELARLRANPELLGTAIEEVMRFGSPVQVTVRRATRDTEIAGKPVTAGQPLLVWIGSANRDGMQFPDSDRFDIARTPNRHIGFGLGIHFCLGAPLARLEAKIALELFLARYASFERSDDALLPRIPTFLMHGVRSLPLRLTPS